MVADVVITAPLRRALLLIAQTTPTVETCALLGGHDNWLTSIYPVTNVAADPATTFLLDAEGQIQAMKLMRETGESLRGIFHSHPASPAVPSATDKARASYPDTYYLIISLAQTAPETAVYYYDGMEFHPVDIRVSE